MTMITIRGRLAFPALWNPTTVGDGKVEKYRARIIVDPKDKASVDLIRKTREEVAKAKWPKNWKGIIAANEGDKNKETWFEKDYLNAETGEAFDGFEGMFHLSALADIQPTIVDRDRTELSKRDGRPYPGCFCIFKVDIWAQDNNSGRALRCGLAGIQFWKDGDAFGGGVKAKVEDFEDLADLGEDDEPATGRSADPEPRAASRRPAAPAADDDDDIA